MSQKAEKNQGKIKHLNELSPGVDYSLLNALNADPDATESGEDFQPRQVFSGHYVPVKPTPLPDPEYIAHSQNLFNELGFDDQFANDEGFQKLFSGDLSHLNEPFKPYGWATGYALSIYGTEYTQQCPFRTGNGYGDGRAISVLEMLSPSGQRWEMQLKGAGRTPYCRGGDGRAVLRSSVREFLAQEHMHALGIATSRSLSLFVSKSEQVHRPWYREGSRSEDPEIMVANPVAISTRVAPSFIRVGQLELFARRVRNNEHAKALNELTMLVEHLIEREYQTDIDPSLPLTSKIPLLANHFCDRLTSLVANWLRVGYCQGNFNSDNCAAGGYTLDYGPFGFMEPFDAMFQPWTGGGRHFSFLNQPLAAEANFKMFCASLKPLVNGEAQAKLAQIEAGFAPIMRQKLERMWADKLALPEYKTEIVVQLLQLMMKSQADYTLMFRELSNLPSEFESLEKCFYQAPNESQEKQWRAWLSQWRRHINADQKTAELKQKLKKVNPKYSWREWLIVPTYEQAMQGDYSLLQQLQQVLNHPYDEQDGEVERTFYQLRPAEFFGLGGVNHYSCSS
ncbi:protein adenylyltransferase SelO family protein [Gayadomonas joobiniege]|uniref:protein adenylyltransferase SelO family protein n=1 Tax=Gayadomonas joobiniege TaxID=1234606 RepID=UPI000377BD7E|nr:protein adenylyltransferase SelO family protein [Gayadomonas joobiniege]